MNIKVFDFLRFLLLNNDSLYSIKDLSKRFNVTERTIQNYLSSIESFFRNNDIQNKIVKIDKKFQFVGTKKDVDDILNVALTSGFYNYKLSKTERQFIICFFLLTATEPLTINYFENMLYASRITISNDIKSVISFLELNDLNFSDTKNKGYVIEGKESSIRNALISIFKMLKCSSKDFLDSADLNICQLFIKNKLNIDLYKINAEQVLTIVEQHFKLNIDDNAFFSIILFLSISLSRIYTNHTIEADYPKADKETRPVSEKIIKILLSNEEIEKINYEEEVSYLAYFLNTKNITSRIDAISETTINYFVVVKSLLFKLSHDYGYNMLDDYNLQQFLTAHVSALHKRIKNNDHINNPYTQDMISSYSNEYRILKKNIYVIEDIIGCKISIDEEAYILMHIVASLERMKRELGIPKILVVCHAGFGTSHLLAESIKNSFRVEISDIVPSHSIDTIYENLNDKNKYDFIVSTVPLKEHTPVPWVHVNPILTGSDIEKIHKMMARVSPGLRSRPYDIPSDQKKIANEISQNSISTENDDIMISDLLSDDFVILDKNVSDWKEAIIVASEPLLWSGKITDDYMRAMVDAVLNDGPYIVFCPGVAFAHADPYFGAKEVGASFLRLKNAISFGHKDNDPVRYVISFSSAEISKTLNGVSRMMNILCKQEALDELNNADSPSEIISILKKYESSGVKHVKKDQHKQ